MPRRYRVYIMTILTRTLHVGMTSDLVRRVAQHKSDGGGSITRHRHVARLAYFEEYPTARSAIEREKPLKGWRRERKVALIKSLNPGWRELADEWFEAPRSADA
ncbi:MAG: GIY-YIG nuclease family protein [Phycisphaerae bacterium]|jgi:putative endonuclease